MQCSYFYHTSRIPVSLVWFISIYWHCTHSQSSYGHWADLNLDHLNNLSSSCNDLVPPGVFFLEYFEAKAIVLSALTRCIKCKMRRKSNHNAFRFWSMNGDNLDLTIKVGILPPLHHITNNPNFSYNKQPQFCMKNIHKNIWQIVPAWFPYNFIQGLR